MPPALNRLRAWYCAQTHHFKIQIKIQILAKKLDKRYYISNAKLRAMGWVQTIDFDAGLDSLLSNNP